MLRTNSSTDIDSLNKSISDPKSRQNATRLSLMGILLLLCSRTMIDVSVESMVAISGVVHTTLEYDHRMVLVDQDRK